MRSAPALLAMAALLLAGCAVPQQEPTKARYVSNDYAAYRAVGNASIEGQAFMRQQGGGVVTCAGGVVRLLPASPFFNEFRDMGSRNVLPANRDEVSRALNDGWPKTTCDAQGNFRFEKLTAGKWTIMTVVQWTVGNSTQGGALMQDVALADGEAKRVLLTDQDRFGRP